MRVVIKPNSVLAPLTEKIGVITIIYDKNNNPVLVAEELDNGALLIKSVGEQGFSEMLRMTGINTEKVPSVVSRSV